MEKNKNFKRYVPNKNMEKNKNFKRYVPKLIKNNDKKKQQKEFIPKLNLENIDIKSKDNISVFWFSENKGSF
jgi:hypothetical protein